MHQSPPVVFLRGWSAFAVALLVMTMLVFVPGRANAATSFVDVSPGSSEFSAEILWLADSGITTGWDLGNGTAQFRPYDAVTRDAMAAFLYRYAGSPAFTPPAVSPFSDVDTTSEFYREITWLASTAITTGWNVSDGKREFRPFAPITRDAMAAFLFRYSKVTGFAAPTSARFADVPVGANFSTEIAWLAGIGITAGYDRVGGLTEFRPWNNITRDAMAAFLFRHKRGGLLQFTAAPTPVMSGTAAVGATLTAAAGSWLPAPGAVTFQWLRDGQPIWGATGSTYRVVNADASTSISVRVAATRDGYLRRSMQSAAAAVSPELGTSIAAGERMPVGTSILSANKHFKFTVGSDGNLVVNSGNSVIWQSRTRGNAVSQLRLEPTGGLTLVRTDSTTAWTSTPGTASGTRLVLQNNGALEVVTGAGAVLWSSAVQGSVQFRLPWASGARWSAGGAHGDWGQRNALDFGPSGSASPRVLSIADGTVRWVSCGSRGYLAVEHADGWTSSYYHLANAQTQLVGQRVPAGTYLGDAARAVPCGGGATFNHVHLSITYKGMAVPMNGFVLGGFTVYASANPYSGYFLDGNGNRVLTAPDGARCCLQAP